MAIASRRSYWAFVFSMQKLCPPLDLAELGKEWSAWVYLWTWTCPDEHGRTDIRELARRWAALAKWLHRSGKRCVRVFEAGSRGGAFHVHAVTPDWWDVNEIRRQSEKCLFGRINVKRIPREKISYLAKYLRKETKLPEGVRRWGAVGFPAITKASVKIKDESLTLKTGVCENPFVDVVEWLDPNGVLLFRRTVRKNWDPNVAPIIKQMKLTNENTQQVMALLLKGKILCVGEYRRTDVREIRVTAQGATGARSTRVIVEHTVELGDGGQSVKCSEWLPDGADKSQVKAPAARGEPVLVEVESMSRQYGVNASSIRSLASMGGKL